MDITETRPATSDEWDHYYQNCPVATFFQGREWAEIWEAATDGAIHPAPRLVTFADDAKILLPFSAVEGPATTEYRAAPEGTYGAPLYEKNASLQDEHSRVLFEYLNSDNVRLRQNPFDPWLNAKNVSVEWEKEGFTQALRLEQGFDAIHDTLRKNDVYRKYGQARDADLSLELVSNNSPAVIDRFYEIYQACRERWGEDASHNYDKVVFESFDFESPDIDFWVVKQNSMIICGGPFLRANNFHVVSWLTLADPSCFDVRPYEFIYYRLISHYCDEEFSIFDFNPSGGHEGVIKFKDNFGTDRIQSNVFDSRSTVHKGLSFLEETFQSE
jgi:hypothetical protein